MFKKGMTRNLIMIQNSRNMTLAMVCKTNAKYHKPNSHEANKLENEFQRGS